MNCKESAFVAMHLLYKSPVTNQLQISFCKRKVNTKKSPVPDRTQIEDKSLYFVISPLQEQRAN